MTTPATTASIAHLKAGDVVTARFKGIPGTVTGTLYNDGGTYELRLAGNVVRHADASKSWNLQEVTRAIRPNDLAAATAAVIGALKTAQHVGTDTIMRYFLCDVAEEFLPDSADADDLIIGPLIDNGTIIRCPSPDGNYPRYTLKD